MGIIKRLQEELKRLWTDEQYSNEFRARPSLYKDFDHALKHVRKAAQALENMTEEADHSGMAEIFDREMLQKYIADIVISAVRLANVAPGVMIDLEDAILQRIELKMGAKIVDQETNLIAALRRVRCARAGGCSTGEAMAKSEFWAREALSAAGVKDEH